MADRPRTVARELDEELAAHASLRVSNYTAAGLPLEAANARARREMGNMTVAAAESARIRGFPLIEQFLADLRFGFRAAGFSGSGLLGVHYVV